MTWDAHRTEVIVAPDASPVTSAEWTVVMIAETETGAKAGATRPSPRCRSFPE
jgi:hypothetical protein